jgi:serine kinase of HPr protein (carbohydrate metabolism regulator)
VNAAPTIHASAVLVGARAVLVRGPAGSGKSRLALNLIQAAASGHLVFARLVADDRVHVEAAQDRVIARPPAILAGLLEVRGLGILRLQYEPMALISWVVDLDAAASVRLPDAATAQTAVAGVTLPRLAIAPGCDPVPLVLAAVTGCFRHFDDAPAPAYVAS